jgi:catecholate siderophore receptor
MTSKLSKRPLTNAIESIDFSRELPVQRKSRAAALPLGALMLAASVSSWAQTPANEKALPQIQVKAAEEISSKDTLRTTKSSIGKGNQDIRDIPQSISVLTEKLLEDTDSYTLKEALKYTSGITFAAAENGTDQDIRMRGFPVAQTGDLMLDGMRDPSQYDRDTFNTDKIEIMRGSASMIFGRGSTGGVINQVSKKPFLNNQHQVNVTAGTGSFYRVEGDFNIMTSDDAALRINVMGNKADNDGAKIKKYGVAPTFSWGLGTRDEFTIGAYYLDVDNVPVAGVNFASLDIADPNTFYGSDKDYLKGKGSYIHASQLHTFDDGGTLRTQFRTGEFEREIWGSSLQSSGSNPYTVFARSSLTPRKQKHETTYLQSDYSNSLKGLGMQHDILVGVDFAYEKLNVGSAITGTFSTDKGRTSIANPNSSVTDYRTPQFKDNIHNKFQTVGIYGQDLIQFAPMWKLLVGARLESFHGDLNVVGKPNHSMSDTLLSTRYGLLFQPTDTSSYHISYSTSFNTNGDTYQYSASQPNDDAVRKALNTPPEKSRNIEIGAKLEWLNGTLSTRGALFHTEKYNERTTDEDVATDSYMLSGKRHARGLELDIVGKLTDKLELYFSYTNIFHSTIDEAAEGNELAIGRLTGLTPKHTFATWVGYQATDALRVAGGITGRSQNYALGATTGANYDKGRTGSWGWSKSVPGYATLDAMVDYKINNMWSAKLNVTNILNKTYGDQLYPAFVVLGPGRGAQLTVTANF